MRGKDCQQVWSVKKDLQKIKMEDVNLLGQNKLFINIFIIIVHIKKFCGPRAKSYTV